MNSNDELTEQILEGFRQLDGPDEGWNIQAMATAFPNFGQSAIERSVRALLSDGHLETADGSTFDGNFLTPLVATSFEDDFS